MNCHTMEGGSLFGRLVYDLKLTLRHGAPLPLPLPLPVLVAVEDGLK